MYTAIEPLDGRTEAQKYLGALATTAGVYRNDEWALLAQDYLHCLAGSPALGRRKAVERTLTHAQSPEQIGVLIHVLGDTYGHAYSDSHGTEMLYPTGAGHGLTVLVEGRGGSATDAIGLNYTRYRAFVTDLYWRLGEMNEAGGRGNPDLIYDLLTSTASFGLLHDRPGLVSQSSAYAFASEYESVRAIAVQRAGLPANSFRPEYMDSTLSEESLATDRLYSTLNRIQMLGIIRSITQQEGRP